MSSMTPENERFGRRAHEKAWEHVYKPFLPDDAMLVDLDSTKRDLEKDEDRAARIFKPDLDVPVEISFQEKYRRDKWAEKRELTLAYYNATQDESLYLEKSEADFFVYGYYDSDEDTLLETVVVDMARLRFAMAADSLPYEKQAHGSKGHHFVCIPFDALEEEGLIEYHHNSFHEPDSIETYERGDTIRQFRDTDYWVTKDGHVWSNHKGGNWLTEAEHDGYRVTEMQIEGDRKRLRVHRVVAEVYHGDAPSEEHQVHHKNEIRHDNRASNLKWVTTGKAT